jgi:hypothetical protein
MRLFRIDWLGGFFLTGALLCTSLLCHAQVDTVEVRIWGGQQDDRGVRLISLQNGDVLSLSSTNSTSNDQPQAWVQRLGVDAETIWETTLNDEPLLQPVDAVEHEDGRITILSMRYANAADGYDWQWHVLDSNGSVLSNQTWGTAAWDLPLRCFDREGELWSVGTTYLSGSGDAQWTQHMWMDDGWVLSDASTFGSDEEEVVTDALIVGDTLFVSATLPGPQRAQLSAYDLGTEETAWSFVSTWDDPTLSVALDSRNETIAALMNVETEEGMRLAFACLSLDGDTLLEKIPGSGVDVESFDLQWYSNTDFATISMTEDLGLGGEELLFSRWSAVTGAWQGGPTFGTQWDERPACMLHDAFNRMWILGRTDGYSNGRDDVYLLQLLDASVGDYYGNVETNISDVSLSTSPDLLPDESAWQVVPNPVSGVFEILGHQPGQHWQVMDASGRIIAEGSENHADASQWPVGVVWMHCSDANESRFTRPLALIIRH